MTDRPDPDGDAQLLDPQLLEFARRFDPARHLPDSPSVTAEQIRRNAELRERTGREWLSNPMSRPMRQFWLPAFCVAAIVLLTAFGVGVLRSHQGPELAGSSPSSSAPPPSSAGTGRPAPLELPAPQGDPKRVLSDLAQVTGKQPPHTPSMFTYVRRQTWAAVPAEAITATDIQTWLRGDHSAIEQITTLPPQAAGARTAQWTQQLPADLRPAPQTFGPGGYPHPVPAPAAQAGLLAAQIGNAYKYRLPAGVADIFRLGLSPAQREAALQVLAGVENLAYHGMVKDRASRTGIAISSTDPGTGVREVLIFHPDTGELLDHESWVSGPGGEVLVDAYTLILDIHTTNTGP